MLICVNAKGSQVNRVNRLRQLIEASNSYIKKRVLRVRNGKKELVTQKVYKEPCKDGWRRDPKTDRCVKMSPQEIRNRKLAAQKVARNPTAKRNRAISLRRRSQWGLNKK